MTYIFVLFVLFIPFWFSIAFKYSGWLTKIMMFLWCLICSVVIIGIYESVLLQQAEGIETGMLPIVLMCLWYIISQYIGIRCVLSDRPGTES